jgi:phosphoglycolate phosphatase
VTRLVVFDLDGTLIDSRRDLADAANALVAELGGAPLTEEQVAGMVGEGAALLVRRALRASGVDPDSRAALARFLELYDERLLAHTRAYEGIPEALAALAPRVALAVLTNKPAQATERILSGLGLRGYFRDVIGGDSPLGRKPDPAGLVELMSRAGARLDETVLVGDSHIDLETARRAGVRICLARYGFGFTIDPLDLYRSDVLVDSPGELEALGK